MKIKLFLSSLILLIIVSSGYSQINLKNIGSESNSYIGHIVNKTAGVPQISLGAGLGLANIENNAGFGITLFSEIKTESFSFVPQANYWKNDDRNNFEIAGLMRVRFRAATVEPYLDGGIGVNFLTDRNSNDNRTRVGLDLGGGIDFNAGPNYTLFADAKYKIIINNDKNIMGFTILGGIRFTM
ncbi:MAG: outer membrane beta-barrel protein [Bacteroidetes bacterium]|nr:outer membrane beta-barrel protein [Bacteroidota bacterium]